MSFFEIELSDTWGEVKALIENESFDEPIFKACFENVNLVSLTENKAIVVAPTFFQKNILAEQIDVLNDSFRKILKNNTIFCEIMLQNEFDKLNIHKPIDSMLSQPIISSDGINTNQTFDSFVVGPSNNETYTAALTSAKKPGKFFTPLFIYGNSGLGKTHLLNAIGNYIKDHVPNAKILYTSSSDFVAHVVNNRDSRSLEAFKNEMYNLDVLLIDDIQFLAGKEKSHEIFFHIFNELVKKRKQIVITSDSLPTEIKGLEERLISRFSSGLSVGVSSPDFETSFEILKMKLKTQSVDPSIFDEDALKYIALNFSKEVRMLEGALNRLLFFSIQHAEKDHIDIDITMDAFKNQVDTLQINELTTKHIKKVVAEYYGLNQSQLVSKTRTKVISNARHIAIYLCRKHLDIPYHKIGEDFGKRDHSTIINACEKIEKTLQKEPLMVQVINEIENKFVKL